MCRSRFYPFVPDQRVKKKSLRASESVVLLKIEGFNGKFGTTSSPSASPVRTEPSKVTSSREEEKSKPTASFKLKKAFEETAQNYDVSKPEETAEKAIRLEAKDVFDREGVEKALDAYIRTHRPETTVAIALKTHSPKIQGEEIVLEIDNKLQLEKLKAIEVSLLNELMKSLNNGFLSLSFRFFDDKTEKTERRLITSQDKLEHFIERNPVVAEMKRMFGLEFE